MMVAFDTLRQLSRVYKTWKAATKRAVEATNNSQRWRYYVDRCDREARSPHMGNTSGSRDEAN